MVGIPGKSKGCTTCRRRKIRCDLQQPRCDRCRQSGRECEGYDRYPVFLNRTPDGLQKRERLEETKLAKLIFPVGASVESSKKCCNASSVATPVHAANTEDEWSKAVLQSGIPIQVPSTNILREKVVSLFRDMYLPAGFRLPGPSPITWLSETLSLSNPGRALSLSIQALSTTRVGRIGCNDALTKQGNMLYVHALRELRKALLDRNLIWQDETLAAARLLGIYEIFESTSNSIDALSSHEAGIKHLIQIRGPDQHRSAFGLAILEDVRYSCMMQSLYSRKASILGDEIWRTRPWDRQTKSLQQKLYDEGYALAALLEEFDRLRNSSNDFSRIERLILCLRHCSTLDIDLDAWYHLLHVETSGPLFWPAPSSAQSLEKEDGDVFPEIEFPNFHVAHLHMTIWALRIILSATITSICKAISLGLAKPTIKDLGIQSVAPLQTDLLAQFPGVEILVQQARDKYCHAQRFELASNVMGSVSYCNSDSIGLLGAQKCIFPLRTAMAAFEAAPGAEQARCCKVYCELYTRRKVRYARDLAMDETIDANLQA